MSKSHIYIKKNGSLLCKPGFHVKFFPRVSQLGLDDNIDGQLGFDQQLDDHQ